MKWSENMSRHVASVHVRECVTMLWNNDKKHIKLTNYRENKSFDMRHAPEYAK